MAAGDRMYRVINVEILDGKSVCVFYSRWVAPKDNLPLGATNLNFEIPWKDFQKLLTAGERSALTAIQQKLAKLVPVKDPVLKDATRG